MEVQLMTETEEQKTVIVGQFVDKDKSVKNWWDNTFIRKFLIRGGKKRKVSTMLIGVTDEELQELKEQGIVWVDVAGGDIVYPEVVSEDTEGMKRLQKECDRMKFLLRFYDEVLSKNFSDQKLQKIMQATTMVDGKRWKNEELIGEIYATAVEGSVKRKTESKSDDAPADEDDEAVDPQGQTEQSEGDEEDESEDSGEE
jgi:hypothetical protein